MSYDLNTSNNLPSSSSSSCSGIFNPGNTSTCKCNPCCRCLNPTCPDYLLSDHTYTLLKKICRKILKDYTRQQRRESYTLFEGGNSVNARVHRTSSELRSGNRYPSEYRRHHHRRCGKDEDSDEDESRKKGNDQDSSIYNYGRKRDGYGSRDNQKTIGHSKEIDPGKRKRGSRDEDDSKRKQTDVQRGKKDKHGSSEKIDSARRSSDAQKGRGKKEKDESSQKGRGKKDKNELDEQDQKTRDKKGDDAAKKNADEEKRKKDAEEKRKKDAEEKKKRDAEEKNKKAEEERKKRDADEKKKAEEEKKKKETEEKKKKEEEEKKKKEAEAKKKKEDDEKQKKDAEQKKNKDAEDASKLKENQQKDDKAKGTKDDKGGTVDTSKAKDGKAKGAKDDKGGTVDTSKTKDDKAKGAKDDKGGTVDPSKTKGEKTKGTKDGTVETDKKKGGKQDDAKKDGGKSTKDEDKNKPDQSGKDKNKTDKGNTTLNKLDLKTDKNLAIDNKVDKSKKPPVKETISKTGESDERKQTRPSKNNQRGKFVNDLREKVRNGKKIIPSPNPKKSPVKPVTDKSKRKPNLPKEPTKFRPSAQGAHGSKFTKKQGSAQLRPSRSSQVGQRFGDRRFLRPSRWDEAKPHDYLRASMEQRDCRRQCEVLYGPCPCTPRSTYCDFSCCSNMISCNAEPCCM